MNKIFNYHPFTEVDFDNKVADQPANETTPDRGSAAGNNISRITGRPITGNDILRNLDRNHDLR